MSLTVLATTTASTSSPNPSAVNQSVLLAATGSHPIPWKFAHWNGHFQVGNNYFGAEGTVSSGQATLNYSFTSLGTAFDHCDLLRRLDLPRQQFSSAEGERHQGDDHNDAPPLVNPSQSGETVKLPRPLPVNTAGTPTGSITFKEGPPCRRKSPSKAERRNTRLRHSAKGSISTFAIYGGDANFHSSYGSENPDCGASCSAKT